MRFLMVRRTAQIVLGCILLAGAWTVSSEAIAAGPKGTVSGLPVPRYVSLKSDRVNMREGPSKEHRTAWVFQRAGLPVEIIAEFDNWRRIRDAEGTEGWVLHSLLSGKRSAIVAPWRKGATHELRDDADKASPVVAKLESGVVVSVRRCSNLNCRVVGKGFDGFLDQKLLWGVYPDEKID
jgi:SH3-like domain-containing protein